MAAWQTKTWDESLRRLRRLASLTQEELAERSGVSVDVIRQLEQHEEALGAPARVHALANGLGVELTTLLGHPPAVSSHRREQRTTLRGRTPRHHARALGAGDGTARA
ncbi:hypothetical protein SHIRM173S_02404 [Streptomyces hirsutus]